MLNVCACACARARARVCACTMQGEDQAPQGESVWVEATHEAPPVRQVSLPIHHAWWHGSTADHACGGAASLQQGPPATPAVLPQVTRNHPSAVSE